MPICERAVGQIFLYSGTGFCNLQQKICVRIAISTTKNRM
jgi:hypothetical protein